MITWSRFQETEKMQKSTTYMHWPHSRGIWGTGEPQVGFGDVLACSNNGAILPAEAFLCPIRQVQGIDRENQGL